MLPCIVLLVLLRPAVGLGQSKRVSEIVLLKQKLNNPKTNSQRAIFNKDLGQAYLHYNLDSAFKYLSQAKDLSGFIHDPELRADLLLTYAECVSIMEDKPALEAYEDALNQFRMIGDISKEIEMIIVISGNNLGERSNQFYLDLIEKGISKADQIGDLAKKSELLYIKGNYYRLMKDLVLAEQAYQQSLEIHNQTEHPNPSALISEFGNFYFHSGRYQTALKTYKTALPFLTKTDDQVGFGYILTNIAMTEEELGFLNTSLSHYNDALEARVKSSDWIGEFYTLLRLGNLYLTRGEIEKAKTTLHRANNLSVASDSSLFIFDRSFLEARINLMSAGNPNHMAKLASSDEVGNEDAFKAHMALSDFYLDQGNPDSATYHAAQGQNSIRDTQNPTLEAKLILLEANHAYSQEEHEQCQDFIMKGQDILQKGQHPLLAAKYTELEARLYKKIGELSAAYDKLNELETIVANQNKIEQNPQMNRVLTETRLAFRESDIYLHEIRQKQLIFFTCAIGLLSLVIFGILYRYHLLNKSLLKLSQEKVRLRESNERLLQEKFNHYKTQKEEEKVRLVESIKSKNQFLKELKSITNENLSENPQKIRHDLQSLIDSIQGQLGDKGHDNLIIQEEDFIVKLKSRYPELSAKEIRLCLYTKMNFSNKEIAEINHVQLSSIEKSKYRLRVKLGLESSADLKNFLSAMSA